MGSKTDTSSGSMTVEDKVGGNERRQRHDT